VRIWRMAIIGAVTSGACASAERQATTTTTRDSAGIRIVENQAPAQPNAPWTLDTVAGVDLGSQSADPNHEFSGYVVPFRLADGRLVVANGGSNELRFFGPDGVWQKSVGRRGSGPGEFEQLGWLDVGLGDTLRTYDWSLRRLSVFSADGAFLRLASLRPTADLSSPRPIGMMRDGRLIVQGQNVVTPDSKPGVTRDLVPLHAYDAAGEPGDSLGRFPGDEHIIKTGKGSVSVSGLPFGKELSVAVDGSRLYIGTSDGPEILVLGSNGVLERVVRWKAAPVPVTPADIEAYIAAFGEGWRPGQEEMRDRFLLMLKQAPFPKWKPSYAGILIGPEGSIWIRRYTEPDRSAPTTFEVLDSTGMWLGGVQMPVGYNPTQILPAFVVGTWKDDNDVQHVRVYRLSVGR